MKKPIITLKSVKYLKSLSEETPAYTAKIYVNGKFFSDVSNDGHGGSDMYDDYTAAAELDKLIAATYEKSEFRGMVFNASLESICHGLVYDEMDKKEFKSLLARKVVMLEPNKTLVTLKGKKSPALIEAARKKFKDSIILNALAFDEAYEIYKQA